MKTFLCAAMMHQEFFYSNFKVDKPDKVATNSAIQLRKKLARIIRVFVCLFVCLFLIDIIFF